MLQMYIMSRLAIFAFELEAIKEIVKKGLAKWRARRNNIGKEA